MSLIALARRIGMLSPVTAIQGIAASRRVLVCGQFTRSVDGGP